MVIRQYKAISTLVWRGCIFVSDWESCPEVTQDNIGHAINFLNLNTRQNETLITYPYRGTIRSVRL
jgi:hypothetical protein